MPRRFRVNLITIVSLLVCQPVAACASPPANLASDHAFASFAAGAIEFAYPAEWRASEMPRGRDLLLVLTPEEPPQRPGGLREGLWFSYQVAPRGVRTDRRSLAESLAEGLRRDLPKAVIVPAEAVQVAGYPAVAAAFHLPGANPNFAPPGSVTELAESALQGRRWLVRTEEGIVEIHAIAPITRHANHEQRVRAVLASLVLQSPRLAVTNVWPELLDAERIFGTWKSPRALLEVRGDGGLMLRYDRERNYELGKLGLVDYDSPVKELSGQYAADGDLIRIRWTDGSLLNIRWRIARGELLITDHHGRTRRLSRLVR